MCRDTKTTHGRDYSVSWLCEIVSSSGEVVGEGCRGRRGMKLLPALSLPPVGAMDRLPLALPFSPSDLLWRYPLGFPTAAPPHAHQPASAPASAPPSPLMDFKNHLPSTLAADPRVWSREDVNTFLRWCEREFDLPHFDMEMFQMNGKAICLLTKGDLAERCPGAGDVLHNVLQLLVRDAQSLQRCLPSSPVTPTSRHHPYPHPLSPHHAAAAAAASAAAAAAASAAAAAGSPHPGTPGWSLADFQAPNLAHLVHQGNSVTLSPAPSVDSQTGSPQHADHTAGSSYHSSGGSNGSNQSDTDEDSYQDNGSNGLQTHGSPPSTPVNAAAPTLPQPQSPNKEQLGLVGGNGFRPVRDFFPSDTPEPNTNGRLLWDFLQQLLNDPTQRYTNYIAWKNRETGVFKIVDPAGLAKLWGIQKNHLSMNYDKMSRALRYYYRVNILRKVQGERHCYQFLRNPSELKSIKNMSLLRQQMSPTRPPPSLHQQQQQQQQTQSHLQQAHHSAPSVTQLTHPGANMSIKMEPEAEGESPVDDDGPTDLSMEHPTDLSPTRHTALTDCTAALLCHVVKVKPDTPAEASDEK